MVARADSSSALIAAALALTLASGGCGDDDLAPGAQGRAPSLSLIQTGTETVEVVVAGPVGLRALQARLSCDPAKLTLTKVEAAKGTARLNRIFHGDLTSSAGDVVVGLTDTRRVRLPARGALLRLTMTRSSGAAGSATLTVTAPLGAGDGGERIPIQATSLEVKLP